MSTERRVVWTVAMVQLMNVLDFMIVMPLGDDFSKALGMAQSDVGYVAGAYTAAAFLSGVIGARFLDRFDRKRVLLVAMVGLALGTVLGGLATGLGSMLCARIVAGLFGGPATATSLAIVADVVPVERRGRAMSVVMAGFSVASVLGIPLGLMLARHGSWRTPFFVIAALVLVVLVLVASWMPSLRGHLVDRKQKQTPALEMLARREVMLGLATTGCVMFSVFSFVPHIPTYLLNNLEFPRDQYELLYLAGGLVTFAVLMVAGRWVDRHGSVPVIIAGTLAAVSAIGLGFLRDPPFVPVAVSFVMFMASGSLRGVAQSTLATRLPAPNERAQFMSLQSAVQHAAATLGSFTTAAFLVSDPVTKHVSPMWLVATVAMVSAGFAPVFLAASERALRRKLANQIVSS